MAIGDVNITMDSGQSYTLRLGCNAICRLEEAERRTYGEILEDLRAEKPSMRLLRLFIWAGLNEPPQTATMEDAGRALDVLGPVTILAALRGVLPVGEPVEDTGREPTSTNALEPVTA